MRSLIQDNMARIGLALIIIYVALYATPVLSPAQLGLFSEHWGEPLLLVVLVIGLVHGPRRIDHVEERRFWGLLATCFGLWILGTVINSVGWTRGGGYWLELAVDSLFLLSYLACFVAVDQRPHQEPGWSRHSLTYAFSALGTLLFVFATIVYFVILPYVSQGGYSLGKLSTAVPFIALDVLLAIRFLHLAWDCPDRWWRGAYGLLGIASLFWVATDSLEWMIHNGRLDLAYGTAWDVVWYMPFLIIFFVRRSRVASAVSRPDAPRSAGSLGAIESQAGPAGLLLLYAFLFPTFHLALNTLGLVSPQGSQWRETLVLFVLLAFVVLAVGLQQLVALRNRELRSAITVLVSNEQMQQAQKMESIGRLAGGVAHDFNNLLTVIQGNASLVKERLADGKLRDQTDEILKAADRASWLTRQLLAFSRGQVLQPQTLDLSAVVRDAEAMLRRLLGEKIEIQTDFESGPAMVTVDPGQVLQVILNLAVNAKDAMPDGGRLTLRVSNVTLTEPDTETLPPARAGSYAVLTARDTGCGMDAQTRAHVFEPFFTGKRGGVGLGLATVYGIVVQSGGFIRVSSRKDAGSTFRIYLPGTPIQIDAEEAELDYQPAERIDRRATVLIVEDDDSVRQTVRELLDAFGLEVIATACGEEALEVFEESADKIDLLLTDIVMPGISGWELAERVKPAKPGLKILYASGYSKTEMGEGRPLGPDEAYLQKPFDLIELRSTLEGLLGWLPCEPARVDQPVGAERDL